MFDLDRLIADNLTGSAQTQRGMPMGTDGTDDAQHTQNEKQSPEDGCSR